MITTQHNLAGYFTKWNAIKQDLHVSLKSKTQKSNKIIWTVIVLCLSFIDIAMKFEWNECNVKYFYILLQLKYFQVQIFQTCFVLFSPILDCNNKKYPNWKFLNQRKKSCWTTTYIIGMLTLIWTWIPFLALLWTSDIFQSVWWCTHFVSSIVEWQTHHYHLQGLHLPSWAL